MIGTLIIVMAVCAIVFGLLPIVVAIFSKGGDGFEGLILISWLASICIPCAAISFFIAFFLLIIKAYS